MQTQSLQRHRGIVGESPTRPARAGRKKEPNAWPLPGNQVLVGLARFVGFREGRLRPGLSWSRWSSIPRSNRGDDGETSHSPVLLRSIVGATRRSSPGSARFWAEGPPSPAVGGCSRARPDKGGSVGVPRET